ncbi:hypothetical protein GCM10018785_03520 [Streptomyces longispororuber]|uniref:Uncharacterized protein n=1 Tax=Streptomyces longispororuber TaxID=68230 RepID=A0A919DDL5_9ACTN|nr:hypothetical protein GCM10018785_03520 [Streptomyces longispororuber]
MADNPYAREGTPDTAFETDPAPTGATALPPGTPTAPRPLVSGAAAPAARP